MNKLPWNNDIKRRYQVHGYKYASLNKNILQYIGEPPSCFSFIIDRIKEQNLKSEKIDQCVVNEYEPGQGIAPHIDSTIFGDQVINISLGHDIVMDFFGPNDEKKSFLLPKRSLLLVEGDARYKWKHGIAGRKTDKLENGGILRRGRRISLTFRDSIKKFMKDV